MEMLQESHVSVVLDCRSSRCGLLSSCGFGEILMSSRSDAKVCSTVGASVMLAYIISCAVLVPSDECDVALSAIPNVVLSLGKNDSGCTF